MLCVSVDENPPSQTGAIVQVGTMKSTMEAKVPHESKDKNLCTQQVWYCKAEQWRASWKVSHESTWLWERRLKSTLMERLMDVTRWNNGEQHTPHEVSHESMDKYPCEQASSMEPKRIMRNREQNGSMNNNGQWYFMPFWNWGGYLPFGEGQPFL